MILASDSPTGTVSDPPPTPENVCSRKMIADIFGESGDEEEEEFTVSSRSRTEAQNCCSCFPGFQLVRVR